MSATITSSKRFRFRLEVLVIRFFAWLIPKFSYRTVHRLSRGLGTLAYYLLPAQRRIARANLDTAFGGTKSVSEKRRIARLSIQNFAGTMLSLFWAPRLTAKTLPEIAEIDQPSFQRVQELRARGQSVIFVALHYGHWEMLGLATGLMGLPSTIVQETMQNVAVAEILGRLRGHSGHRIISSHRAAVKLLRALQRGEATALLIDQYVAHHHGGQWLDFFGLSIANSPAIGWLATRTNATLIGTVARPLPDGRVRIVYEPVFEYQLTGNQDADVRTINQQCLDFCEQVIRDQPEYWLWSYKRWKTRPTPELGRYPFYSRYKPQD